MSIEELRKLLIDDLEALYFVGGFGGAIITKEEVMSASFERLIEIAKLLGYDINVVDEDNSKYRK